MRTFLCWLVLGSVVHGGMIELEIEFEVLGLVQPIPGRPMPVEVGDTVSLTMMLDDDENALRTESFTWTAGRYTWMGDDNDPSVGFWTRKMSYEDHSWFSAGIRATNEDSRRVWSDMFVAVPIVGSEYAGLPLSEWDSSKFVDPYDVSYDNMFGGGRTYIPYGYDFVPNSALLGWRTDIPSKIWFDFARIDRPDLRKQLNSLHDPTEMNYPGNGAVLGARNFNVTEYPAGDANMDGVFDQGDLIQILQRGMYGRPIEDLVLSWERMLNPQPWHDDGWWPQWAEGDFDGDMQVMQSDLVLALQESTYQPNANAALTPEPTTAALLLIGCMLVYHSRRRRHDMR